MSLALVAAVKPERDRALAQCYRLTLHMHQGAGLFRILKPHSITLRFIERCAAGPRFWGYCGHSQMLVNADGRTPIERVPASHVLTWC